MAYLIGVVLALVISLFARFVGLDRDRAFYPTVMIVIALLYVLFAVIGGSSRALALDGLLGTLFIVAAALGFRHSLWGVVWALAGHGLLDVVHGRIIANPGVPPWWPSFCSAYDLAAAAGLAWLLKSGRIRAAALPLGAPGAGR